MLSTRIHGGLGLGDDRHSLQAINVLPKRDIWSSENVGAMDYRIPDWKI